jgi:flagellar basal body P-ring formation protein FlgA
MRERSRRDEVLVVLYGLGVLILSLLLMSIPVRAFAADIDLPVPASVVYPGQVVLDRGVIETRFRVPGANLSAYVVERGMLAGKVAARTLLPGKPIMLADLKSPDIVRAGVPARIVYREPGLTISGVGTPLASAGEGEEVRVRNVDSGVTIAGIVAADGSIEILY